MQNLAYLLHLYWCLATASVVAAIAPGIPVPSAFKCVQHGNALWHHDGEL